MFDSQRTGGVVRRRATETCSPRVTCAALIALLMTLMMMASGADARRINFQQTVTVVGEDVEMDTSTFPDPADKTIAIRKVINGSLRICESGPRWLLRPGSIVEGPGISSLYLLGVDAFDNCTITICNGRVGRVYVPGQFNHIISRCNITFTNMIFQGATKAEAEAHLAGISNPFYRVPSALTAIYSLTPPMFGTQLRILDSFFTGYQMPIALTTDGSTLTAAAVQTYADAMFGDATADYLRDGNDNGTRIPTVFEFSRNRYALDAPSNSDGGQYFGMELLNYPAYSLRGGTAGLTTVIVTGNTVDFDTSAVTTCAVTAGCSLAFVVGQRNGGEESYVVTDNTVSATTGSDVMVSMVEVHPENVAVYRNRFTVHGVAKEIRGVTTYAVNLRRIEVANNTMLFNTTTSVRTDDQSKTVTAVVVQELIPATAITRSIDLIRLERNILRFHAPILMRALALFNLNSTDTGEAVRDGAVVLSHNDMVMVHQSAGVPSPLFAYCFSLRQTNGFGDQAEGLHHLDVVNNTFKVRNSDPVGSVPVGIGRFSTSGAVGQSAFVMFLHLGSRYDNVDLNLTDNSVDVSADTEVLVAYLPGSGHGTVAANHIDVRGAASAIAFTVMRYALPRRGIATGHFLSVLDNNVSLHVANTSLSTSGRFFGNYLAVLSLANTGVPAITVRGNRCNVTDTTEGVRSEPALRPARMDAHVCIIHHEPYPFASRFDGRDRDGRSVNLSLTIEDNEIDATARSAGLSPNARLTGITLLSAPFAFPLRVSSNTIRLMLEPPSTSVQWSAESQWYMRELNGILVEDRAGGWLVATPIIDLSLNTVTVDSMFTATGILCDLSSWSASAVRQLPEIPEVRITANTIGVVGHRPSIAPELVVETLGLFIGLAWRTRAGLVAHRNVIIDSNVINVSVDASLGPHRVWALNVASHELDGVLNVSTVQVTNNTALAAAAADARDVWGTDTVARDGHRTMCVHSTTAFLQRGFVGLSGSVYGLYVFRPHFAELLRVNGNRIAIDAPCHSIAAAVMVEPVFDAGAVQVTDNFVDATVSAVPVIPGNRVDDALGVFVGLEGAASGAVNVSGNTVNASVLSTTNASVCVQSDCQRVANRTGLLVASRQRASEGGRDLRLSGNRVTVAARALAPPSARWGVLDAAATTSVVGVLVANSEWSGSVVLDGNTITVSASPYRRVIGAVVSRISVGSLSILRSEIVASGRDLFAPRLEATPRDTGWPELAAGGNVAAIILSFDDARRNASSVVVDTLGATVEATEQYDETLSSRPPVNHSLFVLGAMVFVFCVEGMVKMTQVTINTTARAAIVSGAYGTLLVGVGRPREVSVPTIVMSHVVLNTSVHPLVRWEGRKSETYGLSNTFDTPVHARIQDSLLRVECGENCSKSFGITITGGTPTASLSVRASTIHATAPHALASAEGPAGTNVVGIWWFEAQRSRPLQFHAETFVVDGSGVTASGGSNAVGIITTCHDWCPATFVRHSRVDVSVALNLSASAPELLEAVNGDDEQQAPTPIDAVSVMAQHAHMFPVFSGGSNVDRGALGIVYNATYNASTQQAFPTLHRTPPDTSVTNVTIAITVTEHNDFATSSPAAAVFSWPNVTDSAVTEPVVALTGVAHSFAVGGSNGDVVVSADYTDVTVKLAFDRATDAAQPSALSAMAKRWSQVPSSLEWALAAPPTRSLLPTLLRPRAFHLEQIARRESSDRQQPSSSSSQERLSGAVNYHLNRCSLDVRVALPCRQVAIKPDLTSAASWGTATSFVDLQLWGWHNTTLAVDTSTVVAGTALIDSDGTSCAASIDNSSVDAARATLVSLRTHRSPIVQKAREPWRDGLAVRISDARLAAEWPGGGGSGSGAGSVALLTLDNNASAPLIANATSFNRSVGHYTFTIGSDVNVGGFRVCDSPGQTVLFAEPANGWWATYDWLRGQNSLLSSVANDAGSDERYVRVPPCTVTQSLLPTPTRDRSMSMSGSISSSRRPVPTPTVTPTLTATLVPPRTQTRTPADTRSWSRNTDTPSASVPTVTATSPTLTRTEATRSRSGRSPTALPTNSLHAMSRTTTATINVPRVAPVNPRTGAAVWPQRDDGSSGWLVLNGAVASAITGFNVTLGGGPDGSAGLKTGFQPVTSGVTCDVRAELVAVGDARRAWEAAVAAGDVPELQWPGCPPRGDVAGPVVNGRAPSPAAKWVAEAAKARVPARVVPGAEPQLSDVTCRDAVAVTTVPALKARRQQRVATEEQPTVWWPANGTEPFVAQWTQTAVSATSRVTGALSARLVMSLRDDGSTPAFGTTAAPPNASVAERNALRLLRTVEGLVLHMRFTLPSSCFEDGRTLFGTAGADLPVVDAFVSFPAQPPPAPKKDSATIPPALGTSASVATGLGGAVGGAASGAVQGRTSTIAAMASCELSEEELVAANEERGRVAAFSSDAGQQAEEDGNVADELAEEPVPWIDAPIPMRVLGSYTVGAVLSNVILLLAMLALHIAGAVAFMWFKTSHGNWAIVPSSVPTLLASTSTQQHFAVALSQMRCPSIESAAVMYLLGPTIAYAVAIIVAPRPTMLSSSAADGHLALAVFGLLACLGLTAAIARPLIVTGGDSNFPAVFHENEKDPEAEAFAQTVLRLFHVDANSRVGRWWMRAVLSGGEWRDKASRVDARAQRKLEDAGYQAGARRHVVRFSFSRTFALLFIDYTPKFRSFLLVEVALTWYIGVVEGLIIAGNCASGQGWALVVGFVLYTGLLCKLQPLESYVNFGFTAVLGFGQLFASTCIALALSLRNNGHAESASGARTVAHLFMAGELGMDAVAAITILRMFYDASRALIRTSRARFSRRLQKYNRRKKAHADAQRRLMATTDNTDVLAPLAAGVATSPWKRDDDEDFSAADNDDGDLLGGGDSGVPSAQVLDRILAGADDIDDVALMMAAVEEDDEARPSAAAAEKPAVISMTGDDDDGHQEQPLLVVPHSSDRHHRHQQPRDDDRYDSSFKTANPERSGDLGVQAASSSSPSFDSSVHRGASSQRHQRRQLSSRGFRERYARLLEGVERAEAMADALEADHRDRTRRETRREAAGEQRAGAAAAHRPRASSSRRSHITPESGRRKSGPHARRMVDADIL